MNEKPEDKDNPYFYLFPKHTQDQFNSLFGEINESTSKHPSDINNNNKPPQKDLNKLKEIPTEMNEIKSNNDTSQNETNPPPDKKKIKMFDFIPNFHKGDIPEVDEPVKPLTYEETEELLKDPKFLKVKLLKEKMDKFFQTTVFLKQQAGYVKSLVSKDKTRFCYDGFDLDLTYITPRIIAMGYPSKNIEGIYRNNMEDVKSFFITRHMNHYKVYNLCEERNYKDCFQKQAYYPFKDHEAPPLNLIRPFCEDVKKYLDENEKNVVAIHCLAGKGRTGTFVCCLLLYLKLFDTPEECLLYYGLLRVGTIKGVTVPSQIRYIHYFESILKNNIPHPISFKKIVIRKITMYTIPKTGKKFQPNFTIDNLKKTYKYSDFNRRKENYSTSDFDLKFLEFPMGAGGCTVCGDVRVEFFQTQFLIKNDKLFKFWFNTNFVPQNGIYEIKKEGIDKACKDIECKIYKKDFKIELEYIYL